MGAIGNNNLLQLDKRLKQAFQAGAMDYKPVYDKVFNISTPERKDELFTIVKMDNAATEVSDGAAYPESSIVELGSNTVSQKIFKAAIPISDFSEAFDNYGAIVRAANRKAYQFMYAIDQLCVAFFNNPTLTTAPYGITIGTTLTSLISNTQPIGDTGLTFDNRITGALDKVTLNDMYTGMITMPSHENVIGGYRPDRLVVPAREAMNAWQITESPMEPESANNNRNFSNTLGLTSIVWPLLTETGSVTTATACYLLAPKGENGARGPQLLIKKNPYVKRVLNTDTGNQVYQVDMMLNAGIVDWQAIMGCGTY